FETFEHYRTPVDVVTTSEVSVSVTVDDRGRVPEIVAALREFADVNVEEDMAILCVVGENLRRRSDTASRVIGALAAFPLRVVSAPNFAIGVNLFLSLIERAGALLSAQPGFGAWIHELHHAAKKDAPSGTALAMQRVLKQSGYPVDVPIASTRAGAIPGTHT